MEFDNNISASSDNSLNDILQKERSTILDLNPNILILYDRSTDQVILVNKAFCTFTGWESNSLLGSSLSSIFPSAIDTNPLSNQTRVVELITASGKSLEFELRIQSLNPTNQQVLLLFLPKQALFDIKEDLIEQELYFECLTKSTSITNQVDINSAISYAVTLIEELTQAATVNYYKLDDNEAKILKTLDNNACIFLPETIPTEEISALSEVNFWKGNKRTSIELHELAKNSGQEYFLSVPLRAQNKWTGFFVAVGSEPIPDNFKIRIIELLSVQCSNAIEKIIQIENARKTIQRLKQVINIQHSVSDNLEEGVIVLTPDLKIAEMNPAAEILLGYTSKEVFKLNVESVIIGTEPISASLLSAKKGISTLTSSNFKLHNRTGKSFPAQVLSIPIINDGAIFSILMLIRDLSQTEQIQARTQQLEQRALLGEVSAVFAHEVKNPINSIMTGLQFISMNMQPTDIHYDLINRLQGDCQRLTHLMDSTLTFSKPIEYHFSAVDLSSIVSLIIDRWRPRMRRLNITYQYECALTTPLVLGDARALEQVFVNLISNAVQAMDTNGGSLSVKIQDYEKEKEFNLYEVNIADSGPGIPSDIRDHIFEPFVTTNVNGTGLGLAISKRIVSAHKGNIFVDSYPGGTLFHVLLPKVNGDKL